MSTPNRKAIADEFEGIRAKSADGLLDPKRVHDFAEKNRQSAISGALEWDDTVAGYSYRLHQIRQLIAEVRIIPPKGGTEPTRLYVSISSDRVQGAGYRTFADVLSNKQRIAVLLQDALGEFDRVRAKYEHLRQLANVWKAMDEAKRKHGAKK